MIVDTMNHSLDQQTHVPSTKRRLEAYNDNDDMLALSSSKKRRQGSVSLGGATVSPRQAICDQVPNPHDVLCGRGALINKHPGNVVYRRVVEHNKKTYHSCKKAYKNLLARSIVEAVARQKPPGRFLARDSQGQWLDIGKARAIQKTCQALREGAERFRKKIMGAATADPIIHNNGSQDATAADDPEASESQQPQPQEKPLISSQDVQTVSSVNNNNNNKVGSLYVHKERHPSALLEKTPPVQQLPRHENNNNSKESLEEMDDMEIFSDDTMFDELETLDDLLTCSSLIRPTQHHQQSILSSLLLSRDSGGSSQSRILDVYTGVPVVSLSGELDNDNDDDVKRLAAPDTFLFMPTNDDDDDDKDNASVVSLEPLVGDFESFSSSIGDNNNGTFAEFSVVCSN